MKQDLNETLDFLVCFTRDLALAAAVAAMAAVMLLLLMPNEAQAQEAAPWPTDAELHQALQQTPVWQAALARHQAERTRGAATATNPNEWTPSASWAQRRARSDTAIPSASTEVRTSEWSLGMSRGVRLPGKSDATWAASQGQQARADAQLALAWRALMRTWLDDAMGVLRSARQADLAQAQVALWEQQFQATHRRHALGDAARQELTLIDAGRAQSQAQWLQAQQRWHAMQGLWRSRYPALALPQWTPQQPTQPTSGAEQALAQDGASSSAWLDSHPQLLLARMDAEVAEAQARVAEAERHPDPTVGVQFGRERSGAERVVGVSLSWPLGNAARSLQARAQQADAQAARANESDTRQALQAGLAQWHADMLTSQQVWQAAKQALAHTRQAAQAVRKGYELGEGSLSEVLLLQRQWLEQQQAEAMAELDALQARSRWELETGARWKWQHQTSTPTATPACAAC